MIAPRRRSLRALAASRRHLKVFGLASDDCSARQFPRMTSRPRRAGFKLARHPLVVSGRNWSRMRRLTPKSDDGFPQHRADATSASSKRLNRADGNLQLSILIAINCPLARSSVCWMAETKPGHDGPDYLVPNVVAPNSAFWVEGCERQYCGGASPWPPSSAAACQPQRGS